LTEILARIEELSEARHRMAREHPSCSTPRQSCAWAVTATRWQTSASRARRSPSARCRRRSARWAGWRPPR